MQVLRAVYLVGTIFMVTVHSVLSNTLRDAKNMNLLAPSSRSIVCFANSIYANRINSRGMSRVFCDLRSQKTPRGILPVNSNQKILFNPRFHSSVPPDDPGYNYKYLQIHCPDSGFHLQWKIPQIPDESIHLCR